MTLTADRAAPSAPDGPTRELLPVATGGRTAAFLGRELRGRAGETVLVVVVSVLAAAAAVAPVYALGILVDRVRSGDGVSALAGIALVVLLAAVVGGVTSGVAHYLTGRLGERLAAGLREQALGRALTLPSRLLERSGAGDLVSRVSADVSTISKASNEVLPPVVAAVLLCVLSVAAMAGLDWRLGLAGLVALPVYALGLRWYLRHSSPAYARHREAVAERSSLLLESLRGLATVRAYRLERRHQGAIDAASARARDLELVTFGWFTRFVIRVNTAELLGLAAVVGVGFALRRDGSVTVGEVAAAAVLFHRLFAPVGVILYSFDQVQASGASLARLVGVVELTAADSAIPAQPAAAPSPEQAPGSRAELRDRVPPPAPDAPGLELLGVDFAYDPGVPVLKGLSLTVPAGQRVALVGATGAGKSTLAALTAGSLRPDRGTVRAAGHDLAALDRAALRRTVAIITQEVHVFAGPLVDDVRLGRPGASASEVAAALAAVGALAWVEALPDGAATEIGEGGHRLSADQAQQLALARLVLADPRVAVLDEATAEAGSAGARALEQAATAATAGRTALVVAHRLTQAAVADRVIVLEAGAVVEDGTHAELSHGRGRYARLWRAWESRAPDRFAPLV